MIKLNKQYYKEIGKMFTVAIIGAQGTGKTMLCNELKKELDNRNIKSEIINEVARECPFPLDRKRNIKTTFFILANQILKELIAISSNNKDVLITDRSVVCNYIYDHVVLGENKPIENMVLCYTKEHYDLIVKMPIKKEYLVNDNFRDLDEEYQKLIDEELTKFLLVNDINYMTYNGHAETILEHIKIKY